MSFLLLLVFPGKFLGQIAYAVFELLPWRTVEVVAQLSIVVDLAPAISPPFTSGHVHHEVPVALVVVDARIVLPTGTRWKRICLPLVQEGRVWSYPGLADVQVFERVLLFMLPLHVSLFVVHRIPPDVKKPVGPLRAAYEEGAEVEAGAILMHKHVYRIWIAIANSGPRYFVEIREVWRMGDVEGIPLVDVTVRVLG